jgi:opacity protein-like surface antigen
MMRIQASVLLALGLSLAAAPSRAQHVEVSPFLGLGYTTSGGLDSVAPGISALEVSGGLTWGGDATWFFGRRIGAGLSFAQQESRLRVSTASGSGDLFDLSIGQLHGTLTYQWGDDDTRLRPYALLGVGAAFLGASGIPGETKLSWAVGGGVKYYLSRKVGLKVQARYAATRLNDAEQAPFCDPLGFCSGTLDQGEFFGGLVLRF